MTYISQQAIRSEPALRCPLCGKDGTVKYKEMTDRLYQVPGLWNFLHCAKCDVLWLHPRPVVDDIPKCYPDSYFTHKIPEPLSLGRSGWKRKLRACVLQTCFGYPIGEPTHMFVRLFIRTLMLVPVIRRKATMGLGPMLLPYRKGGRILDIGCGNGSYLALMKQLGWEVAGIEIDAKAAKLARTLFGVPVHVGPLEAAPYQEDFFDVVTMSHVIEHVTDPVGFLRLASRFLKPGGQVIIITPNAASLGAKLFGRDWYALDPPRHCTLFTPKSLRACVMKSGCFDRVEVFALARNIRKMYRKALLVRQTGQFRNEWEEHISQQWRTRLLSWVLERLEQIGNPLFQWGEEIACLATKA